MDIPLTYIGTAIVLIWAAIFISYIVTAFHSFAQGVPLTTILPIEGIEVPLWTALPLLRGHPRIYFGIFSFSMRLRIYNDHIRYRYFLFYREVPFSSIDAIDINRETFLFPGTIMTTSKLRLTIHFKDRRISFSTALIFNKYLPEIIQFFKNKGIPLAPAALLYLEQQKMPR
ncbi:MAG: hypothetical protein HY461_00735 [Parcubacteria group bacterium]|nr:hypothetical protein [Parcubacteria group bacterium]